MFQSFSKINHLLRIQWDVFGFLDVSVIFKKIFISLISLATWNFGNFQFWQLAILTTCNFGNLHFGNFQLNSLKKLLFNKNNEITFNFANLQFWHFSILATCNLDNLQIWKLAILAINFAIFNLIHQKYQLLISLIN